MAANPVERLLNVIMTIGSRRRIDRARLLEAIPEYRDAPSEEARLRMFERDKAEILELGIPLRSERDPFEDVVHYSIAAPSETDELDLSPAEYTVLLAASRAWDERAAGGPARRVRAKLLSFGQEADADLLRRTPRGALESLPVLAPLLDAVTSGGAVRFRYRTAGNAVADRAVEPWVVGVHDGHWYVLGYDRDRGASRVFRASRLESFPRRIGEAREPRPERLDLSRELGRVHESDERAAMRVRARPFKALPLRELAGTGPEAEELSLPELPRPAARRLVLGQARWAELLEPAPWRAELEDVLTGIADAHARAADSGAVARSVPLERPRIRVAASGQDRLSRLIAIASHVLSRGEADLDGLAAAFGITRATLIDDLQTLFVCGDLGTGFEDLIEAEWEHGIVRVRNAAPLGRALRLSGAETAALLAGLSVLEPSAGQEAEVVASARAKLIAARDRGAASDARSAANEASPPQSAGLRDGSAALDGPSPGPRDPRLAVRAAIDAALAEPDGALTIRYSSPASAGTSVRRLRPLALESDGARTYLRARCELVDDERTFRLERILEILPEGTAQSADATAPGPALAGREEGDVWVRLEAPARWIAEAFDAVQLRSEAPARAGEPESDGAMLALLPRPVRFALVDAVLESAGAAEVLEPRDLRDTIVTIARDAAERHHGAEPLR